MNKTGAWRVWLAMGMLLGRPDVVEAFVVDVNSSGEIRRWALNPPDTRVPTTAVNRSTRAIRYRLDGAGYSTTNTAAELEAIRGAFDQWQAVSGTHLKFEELPMVTGTTDIDSGDGHNTLFWTRNRLVNGGRDSLAGQSALTYVARFSDGNVIVDADVVFNGVDFRWFTNYEDANQQGNFVDAIALHEIGHFLGLRHSPVGGATMLAVADFGVNTQVGLSADELAAVRSLYGTSATLSGLGRVRGTVRTGGDPVFGAAVFAEDAQGWMVSGTVTRTNGVYELSGLAPGRHVIRVAPLDPLNAGNYLVRGADIAAEYRLVPTEFMPSADREVVVTAGGVVAVDFEVMPGTPVRVVRLLRPTADLSVLAYHNKPVRLAPGSGVRYVGVLTPASLGEDVELTLSGTGWVVGATEVRRNVLGNLSLVAVPVEVPVGTAGGLRNLRLRRGLDVAWAHGFLEIDPPFPDANFDGFDDTFQRRYWTRFTVPEAGPGADPDGDGFANRWESETGSDPTDRMSVHFRVERVQVTAGGARVWAETAAGKRFQLFARDTVPGAEWTAVGAPVTAVGGSTEFVDPTAGGWVRYYRVQLQFP
jgi:hypothetical protein